MTDLNEIQKLIPHRPPFLWVDKIVSCENGSIFTEKTIPEDLDIFKGHYPDNPLMPGVLLCEAVFQSGALLMAKTDFASTTQSGAIPVLTRIGNAKFKRTVLPGDTLQIKVAIKEFISNVCFLKGSIRVNQKVAVQVEFACSFISNTKQSNS
jgi:3-hydroxyacyl-[acyl-carrier-protein] dehydratase